MAEFLPASNLDVVHREAAGQSGGRGSRDWLKLEIRVLPGVEQLDGRAHMSQEAEDDAIGERVGDLDLSGPKRTAHVGLERSTPLISTKRRDLEALCRAHLLQLGLNRRRSEAKSEASTDGESHRTWAHAFLQLERLWWSRTTSNRV